jgi:pimeloyl-ACP methyl ester carboxylesterase
VLLELLYLPQIAGLIPLGVERARHGDFGTLVAAADAFSSGVKLSSGMFLSVVCAEDLARLTDAEAEARAAGSFLGAGWLGRIRAECSEWPTAKLPDAYFAKVTSSAPALVLSGNLDPVTPPSWGEEVAQQLPRSRHVIVPGAGHGVSSIGCVPKLIAEFLEKLAPAALDASCAEHIERPAFFTSLAGPSP